MRRLLAALLAAVTVLLPHAANAAGPAGPAAATKVVVVGVPGLRWDDVTPTGTPVLWRLARTGAVGALSVKAGPAVSCAADGFLTLGAGARATAYGAACGFAPRDLAGVSARNRTSRERADPSALVAALQRSGLCASADGPLAALVVGGQPEAGGCALVVRQTAPVAAAGQRRRVAAAAADAVVADAVVADAVGRRDGSTALLVVGLSETPTEQIAHLHVALAAGPGFSRGALRSASTGRGSYVQLVDVAPTVLQLLGVPVPPAMTGQPWRSRGPALGVAALRDLDRRAVQQKAATVPFVVTSLAVQLVLLVGLLLAGLRPAARAVALAGAAVPGASFLAGVMPWWRAGHPLAALLLVSGVVAAGVAALALTCRRTRYGPVAVVAAFTVTVIAGDLLTGSRLQLTSVTGYSPLVAGRFAGIGNVAFGVYAAAGLLALGRVRRPLWLLVGALALVLVDAAPPWGSDVGGALALVPASGVLVLLRTGRRLSLLRVALAGLTGVLMVVALALVDHARPADRRTHLGRFVDQVRDGTAGDVVQRKAAAVVGLLFHSPVTALLPLVVAAAVVLVLRPPRSLREAFADEPAYRHALAAVGVACALGFVLNDSGAAVPALALVVVLPATVALVSGPRSQPAGP